MWVKEEENRGSDGKEELLSTGGLTRVCMSDGKGIV